MLSKRWTATPSSSAGAAIREGRRADDDHRTLDRGNLAGAVLDGLSWEAIGIVFVVRAGCRCSSPGGTERRAGPALEAVPARTEGPESPRGRIGSGRRGVWRLLEPLLNSLCRAGDTPMSLTPSAVRHPVTGAGRGVGVPVTPVTGAAGFGWIAGELDRVLARLQELHDTGGRDPNDPEPVIQWGRLVRCTPVVTLSAGSPAGNLSVSPSTSSREMRTDPPRNPAPTRPRRTSARVDRSGRLAKAWAACWLIAGTTLIVLGLLPTVVLVLPGTPLVLFRRHHRRSFHPHPVLGCRVWHRLRPSGP